MFKIILYLFLIGHILGDFYLQSSAMAENKDSSFKELMRHGGWYLFAMLLAVVPVFSWTMIMYAGIIALTHLGIDLVKFWLKGKNFMKGKEAATYIIDQILHVVVIVIVSWGSYYFTSEIKYTGWIQDILDGTQIDMIAILSWLLIVLIIIQPVSITIKTVLEYYRPESNNVVDGIPNAGALIGILERCIILALLFAQQYSAIGFVLTAKSVARYNKIAEDPKFSEYYLLGTLLSTLMVIVAYFIIL